MKRGGFKGDVDECIKQTNDIRHLLSNNEDLNVLLHFGCSEEFSTCMKKKMEEFKGKAMEGDRKPLKRRGDRRKRKKETTVKSSQFFFSSLFLFFTGMLKENTWYLKIHVCLCKFSEMYFLKYFGIEIK